jgi:dTDP-4-amino-4,6-dideoxygalactose transaminase
VVVPRKAQLKVQESSSQGAFGAPEFLPFAKPSIDEETIQAVADVLRSGWITTGPRAARFEAALSEYFGGRVVKTFTSATAALEIALVAAGVGPGDEVVTTAMSFAATANVIVRVGAKPVFVDVDLATRNIDLDQLEAALTPRTRALMPVHFAGRPVDMEKLYQIAHSRGLRVIEDAAHAMGASWRGRRIGSFGDIVVFSFHPNKNMTTIEGGALVLDDPAEARVVDLHRFHGIKRNQEGEIDIEIAGGKSNFADVSAVIGLSQLEKLDGFNARRRELAQAYFEHLNTDPAMLVPQREDDGHAWHIFSPLLPLAEVDMRRSDFVTRMHERGIGVGVHYPAIHTLDLYRKLGYAEQSFPNAERIGRETVSLPLFPDMNDSDVERVCSAARAVLAAAPSRRA